MNDIALPTQEEARALTDRIKIAVEGTWQLIREAYTSRTWAVLGYDSWDAYVAAEFETARLALPREERAETVASLREAGMSIPAIASATRLGVGTVHRTLTSTFPDGKVGQPDVITGVNGKSYAATRPSTAPHIWAEPTVDEVVDAEIVEEPAPRAYSAPPTPERAPDRQPRVDVSRTVLVALTELRQTREALEALTAGQLARQDEETRRIWAARLNTELEALTDFHNTLIKENNQ